MEIPFAVCVCVKVSTNFQPSKVAEVFIKFRFEIQSNIIPTPLDGSWDPLNHTIAHIVIIIHWVISHLSPTCNMKFAGKRTLCYMLAAVGEGSFVWQTMRGIYFVSCVCVCGLWYLAHKIAGSVNGLRSVCFSHLSSCDLQNIQKRFSRTYIVVIVDHHPANPHLGRNVCTYFYFYHVPYLHASYCVPNDAASYVST